MKYSFELPKITAKRFFTFFFPGIGLFFVLIASIILSESQQYSLLAQAFIHGHLNFLQSIGGAGQDPVFYHGKIYWSEGMFPAILLMPFVYIFSVFHAFFYQNYLQWLIALGVWWLVFKLARSLNYTSENSALLAFAFTVCSVFIGVASASASWYFAQVVTTFLLFWSLYEYFTHKEHNWRLIGIICGLSLLTRPTAAPILIFYLLEAIRLNKNWPKRIQIFLRLCLPVAGALMLMGLYNFLRFHSPFHTAYKDQVLFPMSLASESQGLFSYVHIPSNLYAFLFSTPTPVLRSAATWTLKFPFIKSNPYGMSIFITSPYFIYLFTRKFSKFDKQSRNLLIAALISAILILSYFGIGLTQFGYRYSLDFLPELFMVFMIVYKKHKSELSRGMKVLISGSGILNLYLLITFLR